MPEPLWTIRSALLDHTKAHLRRIAPKFQSEPSIAGKRLGLRQPITLTDAQVEINRKVLEDLARSGSIYIIAPNGKDITDDVIDVSKERLIAASPPLMSAPLPEEAPEVQEAPEPDAPALGPEPAPLPPPPEPEPETEPAAPVETPTTEAETKPEKVPEIMGAGPAERNIAEQAGRHGKYQPKRR